MLNQSEFVEGYTPCQVRRDRMDRKNYHEVNTPSYADLRLLLRQNLSKNKSVSFEDVVLAKGVFDLDFSVIKGKNIRPHPLIVLNEEMIGFSREIEV